MCPRPQFINAMGTCLIASTEQHWVTLAGNLVQCLQLSFTKKRNSKSLSSHPTMSYFGFLTSSCVNFCQTLSMNTILSMFVLPWSIKCTNQDFLLVPKPGVAFWNLFSIVELVIMGDERASDSIRYTVWRIFFHDQGSVPQRNMTKHFL